MKESTQTLLFLGAAIGSVFLAASSRPTDATFEVDGLIGTPLFNPFEAEEASALRIVRFDEETATLRDFEVAEESGVWSLPSKGGYPADAERQMAEATTGVVDLEILAIASQSAADHAEYGVVEPSDNLEVGQDGVGTRVALESNTGDTLVDVVIGKEVKDADDQRYVRKTTQDVVFVVGIDPEKFSTSFDDWIEDDLLKLNTWDIARVQLKDYSAELVMQGFRPAIAFDPRADLTVDYNDDESEWVPGKLLEYDRDAQQYNEFTLAENEQLSKEQLDALKTALGDLKIVDVERKPSGLSGDLKAGDDFFQDRSSVQSLMERGFAPTKGESGETEVLSSEGEVFVTLKDGVEYVLRFGKLRLSESGEGTASEATESDAESDDKGSGVSRYMFVMARLNDTIVEQPELEAVPEASDSTPSDQAAEEAETSEETTDEEPAEDEAATASRDEVLQRNQRLQDEYNAKIATAKARVEELNDRFGDWYYVISDEVYKKVAIGRDGLIAAKETEADDEAAPADTSGPLGGSGANVPGLPNVPGVDFNPFATLEGQTAEGEEAASEAIDAVEESVDEAVEETADAVKESVDTAAEAVEEAAEATADAVEAAVTNE